MNASGCFDRQQNFRQQNFRQLASWLGVACSTLMVWIAVSVPMAQAQDLSGQQQQTLAAVESALKNVRTNLQLAMDAAGPGEGVPAGSKAKLSKMRLDTAAADLGQIAPWLAELPADQPRVQAVAAEYASIEQGIAALDARLAGKAAAPVAAAPPATTAPAAAAARAATPAAAAATAGTVKLGYPLDDVLEGAQFNLGEVQGSAAALTQLVAELKAVPDPMTIDYRRVQTGMNTIENARRKAGFTKDALAKLPANGEGVAETTEALAAANSEVDAADAYLKPLNQSLMKLIDPASYPEFAADLKRLGELSEMYGDPQILQTRRLQAAAVLTEAPAAKAEAARIAQVYQPLMQQQTEDGKRIEGAGNYFLEKYNAFLAAAEQEKQTLPQQIRADLAEADRIGNEAVTQNNPLLFTGGVPQAMGFAEEKLALYTVLDPAQAPALKEEVENAKTNLSQREKDLADLIIQQNPLPPDRYSGGDRDQVIAVATDAWKGQQADFDVLAARIPSDAWSRETRWEYRNSTWYYVDRSKLQVQLIIADEDDDTLAIIQPINIWMDHQKGDSLIGTPLFSGDETLQPMNYLLRDKIR